MTWHEFAQYLRGVQETRWEQTAQLCAVIANAHISKKSKARSADDFNPFKIAEKKERAEANRARLVKELGEEGYFNAFANRFLK